MKIPRAYLSRIVEVTWMDPGYHRQEISKAVKGRAGWATWREYGIVDDITEGVVRIVHSAGRDPGAVEVDEIQYTLVPEELVIGCRLFKEEEAQS